MPNPDDYQIALNHVEKLLDRRQTNTSFFLSVNTAIAAAIGLTLRYSQLAGIWLVGALLLLIVVGLIGCTIWRSLLRQYQILLAWWFARIRELEANMPESAQLFSREYQELVLGGTDRTSKSRSKIGMTERELFLNWVFMGVYTLLGLGILWLNLLA